MALRHQLPSDVRRNHGRHREEERNRTNEGTTFKNQDSHDLSLLTGKNILR